MNILIKHNGKPHQVLVTGLMTEKNSDTKQVKLTCIISNDAFGKTLTIHNNEVGFTIPVEQIERYLK